MLKGSKQYSNQIWDSKQEVQAQPTNIIRDKVKVNIATQATKTLIIVSLLIKNKTLLKLRMKLNNHQSLLSLLKY